MLSDLMIRLRALFRRREMENELDDELRFHFDRQVEKLLQSGLALPEARRRARLIFGGAEQIKEGCRDSRGVHLLETLGKDVGYALRALRKSPGFTLVAILTLAFGMGINTTIFSFFYTLVLRPLPVKDPGSIVNAYRTVKNESRYGVFSYSEYIYYRDHAGSFSGLAASAGARMTLSGKDGAGETVHAALVSGNYYSLLGEAAALGRTFRPEEDRTPGSHPVAVLSYDFWQRRFGGNPGLLGGTITLNSIPYTVVGIAQKGFGGVLPDSPDLWVPSMMQGNALPGNDFLTNRNARWLGMVGRLKPGTRRDQAQAEINVLARRFSRAENGEREKVSILLTPGSFLTPAELGDVLPVAILLIGAVSLILLIACANIANLLLARGAARQKEIGIRQALGASRSRVVRQLLTENLLLALAGGAAGLLLSIWGAAILARMIHPPGERGIHLNPNFDLGILGYTTLLSLLTGIACGLLPALRASKQSVVSTLKEESRAFGQRVSRSTLRGALVMSQVASSLILLAGAGLLVRAMQRAQTVKLGFEAKDVLVVSADLQLHGYDARRSAAFERQVTERLGALPGVKSVGLAELVPLGTSFADTTFAVEGHEPPPGAPQSYVGFNTISPGYFETLGIPIVRGRDFTPQDIAEDRHVAIINESLARRFWPGKDPIGKRFKGKTWEVVGVAKDARGTHLWSAEEPCLYYPHLLAAQSPPVMNFLVRTRGNPAALMRLLPATVRSMDRGLLVSVQRLEDNVSRWLWPSQMGALLSGALGLLAILLTTIGLYGVIAYAVTQRTDEIGIRVALGARGRDVLTLVLGQGMRLVGFGVAIGLPLSITGARLLAKFLYGLSPADGVTFAAVGLALGVIALLACYFPARRALRVDPMTALRSR
jgi:macrolide transport system ATP-binding/permease protein